jgi:hypothetical protein
MTDDKIRENRLRRMASRQGLALMRSRRRDRRAIDYGKYWLLDTSGLAITATEGVGLDEIERILTEPR